MKKQINVGIVGYKFMGRAHSNAWIKAPLFFDTPSTPVLKAACGRHQESLSEFAQNWGWEETEPDWQKLVTRPDIDIIDIALPQNLHYEVALAAAKAGKHIFCEKPLSMTSEQAAEMLKVCQETGVKHYLNHNYRRVPAVALAKKMIEEGKIGRIFHWRCAYQQDWIVDPSFPLTWQLKKETAQAGPQWDLNSHAVDLAHFLIGDVTSVSALTTNFIKERPIADETATGSLSGASKGDEMGEVTVEDAALMMVRFENGAIGSFEATRFATGRKNRLTFEIYGSKGSLVFDLERMNELQYYSNEDTKGEHGFRTILATESIHPYAGNWWPAGHIIGYEHAFVHAVVDFLNAIENDTDIKPDFADGLKIIQVLEAGLRSAELGGEVRL
ncbi:Gfo/Idh/MocA family protein [Dyadobacter fermentans]|uniref:Oxidoreductase domain protein n=1 Tax=Dyadobacter fermentans (strain ATCC 700827 / DSM 18053 / CIP 107007 / KCTC 52180 / NS114) TaxID=471854 RepID=C6VZ29_DYAFD|nr:Gfo/Idh/MocA family oxidoreductase [Dyadobacter fermentans]ACT95235.1 oxidoreductase domain protein [Dyadobacter fermentans DSM 18053]